MMTRDQIKEIVGYSRGHGITIKQRLMVYRSRTAFYKGHPYQVAFVDSIEAAFAEPT